MCLTGFDDAFLGVEAEVDCGNGRGVGVQLSEVNEGSVASDGGDLSEIFSGVAEEGMEKRRGVPQCGGEYGVET
jgi:hypothetical protein